MASSISIPKGTRDFSPEEVHRREYIFDTIKQVFRLYGYQPIETPAMENLSTLLGKYGNEGDKLLFRILNSGEFLGEFKKNEETRLKEKWHSLLEASETFESFKKEIESFRKSNNKIEFLIGTYFNDVEVTKIFHRNYSGNRLVTYLNRNRFFHIKREHTNASEKSAEFTKGISEKGLRYDLTVPFARYVVQHREEIVFPFKRYQIQPVWRADRPQRGRYREFFQCDVDVIGSDSLLNEYELIKIIDNVFTRLKISAVIKINNRKILSGISEIINEPDRILDITVAIDKIDKIGLNAVNEELKIKGLSDASIGRLQPVLALEGNINSKLNWLENNLCNSEIGLKGVMELRTLLKYINRDNLHCQIELDLKLARGLDYYTGAIIEVKSKEVSIGSICGGGRYDNLTGIFGMSGVSGVGISFGADRIYDVLNQLNLFNDITVSPTEVLVVNFGEKETNYALGIIDNLRSKDVRTELFPDATKIKKQMSYADSKKIPYIIIAGEDEINRNTITIKEMSSGKQTNMPLHELNSFIDNKIKISSQGLQ
jgi:histidyl-tRNA synthetase